MNGHVLILGATSGIARGICHALARGKRNLILAGRDVEELTAMASDLSIRHGIVATAVPFEAEDFASHPAFFARCQEVAGNELAGLVLVHGYMAAQNDAQKQFELARRMVDVNLTSAISICEPAAAIFEQRRSGFIVGVSSVAGDRGRMSNYLYGATKAGVTTYLAGLRARLQKSGVAVLTVKPGFVDTAMTWGLPGTFLVADPNAVGESIARAIDRRRDVIYTPWFWWIIMSIVRAVPEFVFKRTKM
jgi:short-subunit dehydrogenase